MWEQEAAWNIEKWLECRLEISLGCPNLVAFLERAVSSCLYDRNEKNERSQWPIPSIFPLNEKTCLKFMEQIFQINDDLLNEEWFPDGMSGITCPSPPPPPNTSTILEQCSGSCCFPVKRLHRSCPGSGSWLFKGHIMLQWNLEGHSEDIQIFPRKICFKKEAYS